MIEHVGERSVTLRMPFDPDLLRTGGTLSGPALMALADRAAYFLTILHDAPSAVTSSLDIHFLVRPPPRDAIATATLLRAGRRLIITRVEIHVEERLVAHATVTYARVTIDSTSP